MRWAPKDITGQRFGNLTVVEWVGRAVQITKGNGQKTWNGRWRCRCDCGNLTLKRTTALNAKFGRSCGCLVKAKREFSLIGQRFGKLTVLKQMESTIYPHKRARHSRTWWCRCDCGGELRLTTNALRQDRKTSCGCGNKPHNMEVLRRGLKIHRVQQRIAVYDKMRKKLRPHGMTLVTTCSDYIQWGRSYNSFRVEVRCQEGHEMRFNWARIHQDPACRVCRKIAKLAAIHAETTAQKDARLFERRQKIIRDREAALHQAAFEKYNDWLARKELKERKRKKQERVLRLRREARVKAKLARGESIRTHRKIIRPVGELPLPVGAQSVYLTP